MTGRPYRQDRGTLYVSPGRFSAMQIAGADPHLSDAGRVRAMLTAAGMPPAEIEAAIAQHGFPGRGLSIVVDPARLD